jgi:hypothetical protein
MSAPPLLANNLYAGPGNLSSIDNVRAVTNLLLPSSPFQDAANWDFRPAKGSRASGAASRISAEKGKAIEPIYEYVHPASARVRPPESYRDMGALAAAK